MLRERNVSRRAGSHRRVGLRLCGLRDQHVDDARQVAGDLLPGVSIVMAGVDLSADGAQEPAVRGVRSLDDRADDVAGALRKAVCNLVPVLGVVSRLE